MSTPPLSKARPWQGASGETGNSANNLPFPAESASPFTPDLLAIAALIGRARRHERTKPPMVVFADGHVEVL